MRYFIILFVLSVSSCFSDVRSTNGTIKFDVQMDNHSEMTLNSTGLGIGTVPSANLHVNGNVIISDQLFIGGSSGSSNLNVNGTIGYQFETINTNTTLSNNSIVLVDSSSDNITLTLPYAGNVNGRVYRIKKISPFNYLWIKGGGNHIDQQSIVEMDPDSSSLPSCRLISDGESWHIIDTTEGFDSLVLSDNLVGYWNFDETSGTIANDSSQYGHDGTLNGGFTFSDNKVIGKLGYALSFDGVDDSVEIADSQLFDIASDLTISLWFSSDDFSADGSENRTILAKRGGGSTGAIEQYNVELNTSGVPRFGWHSGGSFLGFGFGTTASLNEWTHYTITVSSGNSYKAFLNGSEVTSGTLSSDLENSDRTLYIGAFNSTNASFSGDIDEVRIYNTALDSSDVFNLYQLEK